MKLLESYNLSEDAETLKAIEKKLTPEEIACLNKIVDKQAAVIEEMADDFIEARADAIAGKDYILETSDTLKNMGKDKDKQVLHSDLTLLGERLANDVEDYLTEILDLEF
jgi:hypothetical protein